MAKASSQFDPVTVDRRTVGEDRDPRLQRVSRRLCQLGIHLLSKARPDIVVSGVNVELQPRHRLPVERHRRRTVESRHRRSTRRAFLHRIGDRPVEGMEGVGDRSRHNGCDSWGASGGSLRVSLQMPIPYCAVVTSSTWEFPTVRTSALPAASLASPTWATTGCSRREADVFVHMYGGLVSAEDDANGATDVGAAAEGVIAITPISGAGDAVRRCCFGRARKAVGIGIGHQASGISQIRTQQRPQT